MYTSTPNPQTRPFSDVFLIPNEEKRAVFKLSPLQGGENKTQPVFIELLLCSRGQRTWEDE